VHSVAALQTPSVAQLQTLCIGMEAANPPKVGSVVFSRSRACYGGSHQRLWNSNHVDESYDPAFLDHLAQLVSETGAA
jgi:hypothetical protein